MDDGEVPAVMPRIAHLAATLAVGVAAWSPAAVLGGCGEAEKAVDPLISNVDRARDAQAVSSLQQSLVSAALVRSESGGRYTGTPEQIAQRLQARDPSKVFGGSPSARPEQVQVVGGNGGPLMLVVRSASDVQFAAWDDGAVTLYYRGSQSPQYGPGRPGGEGWSEVPPR